MRYVKWTFWTLLATVIFGFLHYTLPQHDIVRVADTYEKRIDFGENSIFWAAPDTGNAVGGANRDVFFIQTIKPNGKPLVYRNEDTGWGWPPYFKLDTSNLQAEASDLKSGKADPVWVSVTHYGWRNEFLSIYPNAVGVKIVESPDVRIIPWVSIVILLVLAFLVFMLWRMWQQFMERTIDPALEDVGEATDAARNKAQGVWGRFSAWLATWRGKPRV